MLRMWEDQSAQESRPGAQRPLPSEIRHQPECLSPKCLWLRLQTALRLGKGMGGVEKARGMGTVGSGPRTSPMRHEVSRFKAQSLPPHQQNSGGGWRVSTPSSPDAEFHGHYCFS